MSELSVIIDVGNRYLGFMFFFFYFIYLKLSIIKVKVKLKHVLVFASLPQRNEAEDITNGVGYASHRCFHFSFFLKDILSGCWWD